jgi:hypothetical protein
MDDETVENLLYPAKLVQGLGFESLEHFQEFRDNAFMGALESQDSFVRALACCLEVADLKRAVKLVWAFKQEFEFAAMAWKMHEARQKAQTE